MNETEIFLLRILFSAIGVIIAYVIGMLLLKKVSTPKAMLSAIVAGRMILTFTDIIIDLLMISSK